MDLVKKKKIPQTIAALSSLTSRAIDSAERLPESPQSTSGGAGEGFGFNLGLICLCSDVLLFGKSVRRHSRRWGGQTLYRGVFEDGCGVRGRRVGVFRGGGGGAAAAGGCGWLWVVRVLGQKREGRVDGGGVGLRVVVLITGQSVAHVIRCVRKLFVKPPRMLQQRERIIRSMINF